MHDPVPVSVLRGYLDPAAIERVEVAPDRYDATTRELGLAGYVARWVYPVNSEPVLVEIVPSEPRPP